MAKIRVTRRFERLLGRLGPAIARRVLEASLIFKDDPLAGKLLKGYYEVRVEDQVIRVKLSLGP